MKDGKLELPNWQCRTLGSFEQAKEEFLENTLYGKIEVSYLEERTALYIEIWYHEKRVKLTWFTNWLPTTDKVTNLIA